MHQLCKSLRSAVNRLTDPCKALEARPMDSLWQKAVQSRCTGFLQPSHHPTGNLKRCLAAWVNAGIT